MKPDFLARPHSNLGEAWSTGISLASMKFSYHVMSSPLGLLFLAKSERGLRFVEFMDRKSIKRMITRLSASVPDETWTPSLLELKTVTDQLDAFFCGTRRFRVHDRDRRPLQ